MHFERQDELRNTEVETDSQRGDGGAIGENL